MPAMDIESISTNLELGGDGIWYSEDTREVSYTTDGHAACFAIEDDSFWFRHRNDCILSVVERFPPEGEGPIFDIGGGNGSSRQPSRPPASRSRRWSPGMPARRTPGVAGSRRSSAQCPTRPDSNHRRCRPSACST